MPTQEERITALEQNTAAHIQEMDENLQSVNLRLITVDESLHSVNQLLNTMDESLHSLKQRNSQFEVIFNDHTALLSQILARLPEMP